VTYSLEELFMADSTATSPEELREYEAYVERMAALADGRVILNHTYAHAEIILAQIFRMATVNVKIVTGKLDETVYGSTRVCDAISGFLSDHHEGTIDVVSEGSVSNSHPLLRRLEDDGLRGRFHLSVLKPGWEAKSHFAVADAQHLRFEAEPAKCEAVVMFGDRKNGTKLDETFHKYAALAA
jgi:hypothetical protein